MASLMALKPYLSGQETQYHGYNHQQVKEILQPLLEPIEVPGI
jgi:hypothetical protein